MEFMEVVRERYSCKDYDSSRQVEKEKLDQILEAGVWLPLPRTCRNSIFTWYSQKRDLQRSIN